MASRPLKFSHSGPLPKVPIPRLEKPTHGEGPSGTKPSRVLKACVGCRARKVRCNGERPRCQNCLGNEEPCIYTENRKDRLKIANERNDVLVDFLKNLQHSLSAEKSLQIEDLLKPYDADIMESTSTPALHPEKSSDPMSIPDTTRTPSDIVSDDELDAIDEDLLRDEQTLATGYIGKSSELQWLRRLRKDTEHIAAHSSNIVGDISQTSPFHTEAYGPQTQHNHESSKQANTFTFYLDDDHIEVDYTLNPYELPVIDVAHRLFECYMTTVQDSFPTLSKRSFTDQFHRYYISIENGTPLNVPKKWLAMLNLVFAIGARYSHLVEANWQADERDHSLYLSRACILGLSGSDLVSPPDLLHIQTTALLAFYYLSVGHVNRAWIAIGFSLRFAHALGLHLRNEDQAATVAKKEALLHIWWSLYSLEGMLSTIVGRPGSVFEGFYSAPLPLPLGTGQLADERLARRFQEIYRGSSWRSGASAAPPNVSEITNTGSFLKSKAEISVITQAAMGKLYSAKAVKKPWAHVQKTIAALVEQLESWSTSLPPGLNFARENNDTSFQRERGILQMQYIGAKMLFTRPCLCRLDIPIMFQSQVAETFNKETAQVCVSAAKTMTNLLPNQFDVRYLYRAGPWWCLVHTLMQALTILLLEMSYRPIRHPQNDETILPFTKKLIRWLRTMKRNNQVAKRAYHLTFEILQRLALQTNADITDLLLEDAAEHPNVDMPIPFVPYPVNGRETYSIPGEHDNHYPLEEPHSTRASGFNDTPPIATSIFAAPASSNSSSHFSDFTGHDQAYVSNDPRHGIWFGGNTSMGNFGGQGYPSHGGNLGPVP